MANSVNSQANAFRRFFYRHTSFGSFPDRNPTLFCAGMQHSPADRLAAGVLSRGLIPLPE
jgi:hypothetical protein